MLFSQANLYGGVDFNSSHARIALLKQVRNEWTLHSLKEIPLQESQSLEETLPQETFYTTAVSGSDILVRPLSMKLTSENDVLDALEFQVENIFPYSAKEGVYQAHFLKKGDGETALSVVALKKESLEKHLSSTPVEPESVTSVPQALSALSTLIPQNSEAPLLMIYGSEDRFQLALSQSGCLIKAYSFSYSSQEELARELRKAALSMITKAIQNIFVLGPAIEKALPLMEKLLPLPAQIPTIPSLSLSNEKLMKYGLAIGIAMMGAEAGRLNFRQKEFQYPRPMRRLWRPLSILCACSCVLTLLFSTASTLYLRKTRACAEKKLTTLCSTLNLPSSKEKLSTPSDYAFYLQRVEKEVEAIPNTFPLYPGVPKVKDFLGWLSKESDGNGVSINSFHYTMERRPEAHRAHDRYKVRVQIELTSQNSADAKRFHELLQGESPYIDPGHPITWEQTRGIYRSSFYLKDKTKYY
jgi:type IV pilus assembly protein PilM